MSLPRLARSKTLPSLLHPHNHPRIQPLLCLFRRNASTKGPNTSNLRPLVLEQPDKFRPPSHGARKPRKPKHFGPALSEEEVKAQNTKKYPHAMPPEGTVMHKFLTSKGIHVWISMSVLISLTGFVLLTDFKTKNKFPELLPPGSLFFSNPVGYIKQYFSVYKLHSNAYMAEQQEKRAKSLDEVRKRKEYLIAHGIDKEGFWGFGTVEGDLRKEKRAREAEETRERVEVVGAEMREGGLAVGEMVVGNVQELKQAGEKTGGKAKKWLGIW